MFALGSEYRVRMEGRIQEFKRKKCFGGDAGDQSCREDSLLMEKVEEVFFKKGTLSTKLCSN